MEQSSEEPQLASGAGCAEERCPICLEDFQDKAFVDACFHTFCFTCVTRWAETTITSCPLCKTGFRKVIHNVRAIDDYDVFKVAPKTAATEGNGSAIDLEEALRNFRGYRTTRFSANEPSTSAGVSRATRRRRPESRKPAALERRRAVYSTGIRAQALHKDGTRGTRSVKTRDISASFFKSNPAATHRLYPWLERELEVLVGKDHIQFVTQIITSVIDKVDLRSPLFSSYLEPYLHDKTDHFLHEFVSFAASPYDLIAYDQRVSYTWPQQDHEDTSQTNQDLADGIQQRIFDELTATGWDESPPIMESTSSPSTPHPFQSSPSPDTTSSPQAMPQATQSQSSIPPPQDLDSELHVHLDEVNRASEEEELSPTVVQEPAVVADLATFKSPQIDSSALELSTDYEIQIHPNSTDIPSTGSPMIVASDEKSRPKKERHSRSHRKYRSRSGSYKDKDSHIRKHSKSKNSKHDTSRERLKSLDRKDRSRQRSSRKHSSDYTGQDRDWERGHDDSEYIRRSGKHRSRLYSDDPTNSSCEQSKSSQTLCKELEGLDSEITQSKKDILKSLLRKERIELLRKNLHSDQDKRDVKHSQPKFVDGITGASNNVMQRELQSLEAAILDGKRSLLKVMMKIEENQPNSDSD